jgi:NlpC/P60 family putative phage cell wall peptidase
LRDKIIAEARTWIGTPYVLGACVRGAGADCATFIYGVLHALGMINDETIGHFSPDWFAHTDEEIYPRRLLRHAFKTAVGISYTTLETQPGNIVLTRHSTSSRVFNHAGIVVKWPHLIHAIDPCITEVNATQHSMWCNREVAVFDPVAKFELEHIS